MILRLLTLVAALAASVTACAHPKPGAHADVRFSVEHRAVRGEFVMNLRFAQAVVNWPQASRDAVLPEEEPALRAAILEYFGGERAGDASAVVDRANSVNINGAVVAPIIREFRIVIPPAETRPGFVDVAQAMLPQVLAVVEYPSREQPASVELRWGTFPRDFLAQDRDLAPMTDIDAVILAEGDAIPVVLTAANPVYQWAASATPLADRFQAVPAPRPVARRVIPVLSLAVGLMGLGVAGVLLARGEASVAARRVRAATVCLGALAAGFAVRSVWVVSAGWSEGTLTSREEAVQAFRPLHANMYRAFDYVAEVDIYDALARSVDGPLLAKTYDDIYRSLIMHEEGGAVSRIRSVIPGETSVERIEMDDLGHPRAVLTARWRVEGVVFHWGHSHSRTNEYLATYTLASSSGAWRIVDILPLEQKRVELEPTLAIGATR